MPGMDLVWFARPGVNEELRFSIRSISQNLAHRDVWVIGHPPSWYVSHLIKPPRANTKHKATTLNMRLAIDDIRISDPFIYVNDDFFLFRRLRSMPTYHRGLLRDHLLSKPINSPYFDGGKATLKMLDRRGFVDPLSFELHVPLIVHKAAMREALELAQSERLELPWKRTIYGAIAGLGGECIDDVKVYKRDDVPRPGTWCSTTDTAFEGVAGQMIRRAFPTPSPFEASRASRSA